jgi:hypothetical protein
MVRAKGLIFLLAILFISIFIGYFLVRINPNYPEPGKINETSTSTRDSGLATTSNIDWIDYSPSNKTFQVKLPSLPQTTSKTFTDPNTQEKRSYEMFVSEKKDGTVFLISIINFKDLKSNVQDDEMLTAVANDMMTTHPDNKLIKTEAGKFKGNPSLKFELASDKVKIDTLTFIIGKKLYVLNRVAPAGSSDMKEFDFFTNSFDVNTRR